MANDPTQPARDLVSKGIDYLIPDNSPLKQSQSEVITPAARAKMEAEAKALEATKAAEEAKVAEAQEAVAARTPSDLATTQKVEYAMPPSAKVEAQQAPAVPQVQAPNYSGMEKVVKEQEDASKSLMDEADKLMAQREKAAQDKIKRTEDAKAQIEKINAENQSAIDDFKFDNRSLWDKSSTGQKVALMLGAFFSSASNQSAQSFRDGVQSTIDRDIAAQKEAYQRLKEKGQTSQNELAKLTAQLNGDVDAAADLLESKLYKGIAFKAAQQSQNAQSRLVMENSKVASQLATAQSQAKLQQAIAKRAEKESGEAVPGFTGAIKDSTERRKFVDGARAADSIKSQLQNLRKITARTGKSFSPEARAEAEAAIAAITADIKDYKQLGTLDKGVETLINKFIQNPTSFFTLDSSTLAKINSFEKYIDEGINKAAKLNGLNRVGSNIGTLK